MARQRHAISQELLAYVFDNPNRAKETYMARSRRKAAPAKKTSIREHLMEVTEINPKKREADDEFRNRLAEAISELDDADWNKLSAEGQAWYNDAVDLMGEGKAAPGFDDEGAGGDDDDGEEEEPKPRRRRRAAKKDEDENDADGDEDEDEPESDGDDDEEEEKPRRRRRRKSEEDDDEEEPKPRRRRARKDEDDDDEEEEKPRRRRRRKSEEDDDEEDPKPRRRTRRAKKSEDDGDGDEDEAPRRRSRRRSKSEDDDDGEGGGRGFKPGARSMVLQMLAKNHKLKPETILSRLEKKGVDATETTVERASKSFHKIADLMIEAGWSPPSRD